MTAPTVRTDRERFRTLARDAPPDARVPVELRTRVADPFDAYRRARDGPGGFFLETSGGREGWGYFGVDPASRLQVSADAAVRERTGAARQPAPAANAPSLAALDGVLDAESLVRGDCAVPYPCGLVGWLSYDVARELESLPGDAADDRGLPHLQLGLYDCVAAWEEPRDGEATLHVTACPRVPDDADDGTLDSLYGSARERARALAVAAVEGDPAVGSPRVDTDEARFESDTGRAAFREGVRRVKAAIRDGDTFQTNLSHRLVAPAAVHPIEAYDALRRVNPAPYSGLLEFPGVDLVSASPELLVRCAGADLVTEPIAGTRRRGDTPEDDDALEADLLADDKERAEHAMLVDLERNDLGKIAAFGSVSVSEYRRVDRYSEVMHLVSEVVARRREDASLVAAVGAVFPGGTITGAPKPKTMELIDSLEATRRGPYTGSVCLFGFDDRATLNIVIRTLVRHADEYHLRVGAGIVHDSDPDDEYDETLAKGRALVTALDEALADRTALRVEGER